MVEQIMITTYETFLVDIVDHVAHVRLNRPQKANALNEMAWQELRAVFSEMDERSDVRVVVLSGEGKNFCAGIDLEMFGLITQIPGSDEGRKREALRKNVLRLQDTVSAIENCSKPVIAAIHRACIGGGVDIIASCDMRYASEGAFFSIAEIDIGMVADLGTLQRLPKLIGMGIVSELAYTGRRMPAEEAFHRSLVNQVFADKESMMNAVMEIARTIALKSPLSIRGTKQVLRHARDHSVADGLEYIATWNAAMILSNDLQEAASAKISGRVPNFDD